MKRKSQKCLIQHTSPQTKKTNATHRLRTRNSLGFTLVELMVVIAIIGVVLAIAIPNFAGIQQKMRVRAGAKELAQHFRHIRERALSIGRNYQITRLDAQHYQVRYPDGGLSAIKLGQTTGGNLQFGATGLIGVTPPEANIGFPDGDGFDFNGNVLIFQPRGAVTKGVVYINDGNRNYAVGVNSVGKIVVYIYASGTWQGL